MIPLHPDEEQLLATILVRWGTRRRLTLRRRMQAFTLAAKLGVFDLVVPRILGARTCVSGILRKGGTP